MASAAITVSTETSRLTALSPASSVEAGYALDGDTLAAGEQFPPDTVPGSSCIYGVAIRERNLGGTNAWGLRKRVVPTRPADCSGAEGGAFGVQPGGVALKGDTLVVSVPHALGTGSGNQAVGRVYVFRRNVGGAAAWGQTAILLPATESAFQYFGGVVAVSGNTVAVGVQKVASASQASDLAVAIYERNPANESFSLSRSLSFAALGASGNAAYDGGTQRLSLDGDYLAASLLIRPSGGDKRVLSIFSRNIGGTNRWGLDKQFQQENHNGALSLSGTRLAAGRQAENPNGGYNGRVALYERGASGWAQIRTFDIPVRDSISGYNDLYGSAVSLSGDNLLVGHDNSPTPAGRTGSAYLYQRNAGGADSWGLVRQFVAGDARAASYSYPIYQSGTTSALLAVSSPESQVIELFSATAPPPVVYDLGDAPSPYAGARHVWGSGLRLGSFVDVEAAQRVGAPLVCVSDYSRDELSGLAGDDDGLEAFFDSCNGIARFTIGAASAITVTSNGGGGKLDLWIDANRDGDWSDAGEKRVNGLATNGNSTTLANYTSASFSIPLAGASTGASWARLRLSSAGTALAVGDAADGEVEDYPVQLLLPFITAECDAVNEGNAGISSQPCRVRLNTLAGNKPVTHQVKVNYQAAACDAQIASRATSGSDFVASGGTLTFEPGTATLNLTLQVQGDAAPEPNETYCLKLSNPVNADFGDGDSAPRVVAYPLINNDDQVSVTLQASTSINEGAAACVSVRLDQATDHVVSGTVGFSGSATAGLDYTASSTSFSIAAGSVSNASCQLKITTVDDTATESDETIVATLKTASGAKIGAPNAQVFTIKDNDLPRGRLQFGAGSYATSEKSGSVTVSVSRVGGSAGAISVRYATADGSALAGSDYTAAAGTLNWAAGDTAAKSFTVAIVNDLSGEKSESFSVVLSGPGGGASLGSPASAAVSVEDNDCLKLGGLFNLCLF